MTRTWPLALTIGLRHDEAIMTLEADILNWDGKSAPVIKAVYRAHSGGDGFIPALVLLCEKPNCQPAATWLLKHHIEKTRQALPTEFVARLLKLASNMTSWEARLHVLQMFDALVFSGATADDAFQLASDGTEDDNTFVRAWGYYGLAVIATAHPHHCIEARKRLKSGMACETRASVKVRLRKAFALIGDDEPTL